ncbi:MAG TPA: SpoIIE family protein phosphatase [Acidobacteriaceae bacterium]|jgi:sigma-B regulation protein RsbU (phosphoserine phosphatase)
MPTGFGQKLQTVIRYKPKTRVGRLSYRLTAVCVLLLVLGRVFHGFFQGVSYFIVGLLCVVLGPLLIVLALRFINRRLLWKVRNRLILTYLLMGLSPVVLFATMASIAAYVLAGQYATNTALSLLEEGNRQVGSEAGNVATYLSSHNDQPKAVVDLAEEHGAGQIGVSLAHLENGVWRALPSSALGGKAGTSPFDGEPQKDWLHAPFQGVVSSNGRLYLCSLATVTNGSRTTSVLGSMRIERSTLDSIAHGLGRISVLPGFHYSNSDLKERDEATETPERPEAPETPEGPAIHLSQGVEVPTAPDRLGSGTPNAKPPQAPTKPQVSRTPHVRIGGSSDHKPGSPRGSYTNDGQEFRLISGSPLAPAEHFFDWRVFFSAPIPVVSWETGARLPSLVAVISRPTLLYAHLFATSVSTGLAFRVGLIVIGIFFGLLEIFALLMAMRLSTTITKSVGELYRGTTEIDRGNLAHRVPIRREDQLGALAHSFNSMAGSIQDLLIQQREKDRLLNELRIAQEVQRNLFPASPVHGGGLDVHAMCLPARTVSGDYFDFIFGEGNQLCIALGDISGKGISAALLMASLHSAVRAFTLGNGEDHGKMTSPAHLLGCLNRHLFRSTQPEKYATLFLAFYDTETRNLTYSNGGHLAPLLLSTDGRVRKLDCGGSVVGLFDNLEYEEATVQLRSGDLLMAFTDGLTEPENSEEEFGEERLQAFVQTNRAKDLDTLAKDTLSAVKQWIGDSEQPDDMTMLLARQA